MTDQAPAIDQPRSRHASPISHRLRRQLLELRKKPDEEAKLAQWVERLQQSCAQVTARRQSVPADALRRQPADRRQARRNQGGAGSSIRC
ncbi:MAG: hypothetical protein LKM38_13440 [Pseudomonas veronii]|nr:hypothetical protein [Pseudomonas veronii]